MSGFRWLLLGAGLLLLGFIWWWSRRGEPSLRPRLPLSLRQPPSLEPPLASAAPEPEKPTAPSPAPAPAQSPERIIAVRLIGQGSAHIPGDALLTALGEAGLRHGRFGIFHREGRSENEAGIFSVASLIEPGNFDPARMPEQRFPGVSFFLPLPAPIDNIAAFDDMLGTARAIAARLDCQLLDEQGSRLSVQRERFLREEVIRFQHSRAPAT